MPCFEVFGDRLGKAEAFHFAYALFAGFRCHSTQPMDQRPFHHLSAASPASATSTTTTSASPAAASPATLEAASATPAAGA